MEAWLLSIPPIDWALIAAVALCALVAAVQGRRGGRYRQLPGWALSWVVLATLLIGLSHLPRWISFPALAMAMFATLRTYFFVAPVRPRDRYAILATYLSIPVTLWPAYRGDYETFSATVPVTLFLFIPVFLSIGSEQDGFLNSVGRTILGVLFFVFCIAHLGLLVYKPVGTLELFGLLVLASELPQRVAGRIRRGAGLLRPVAGIVLSVFLAVGLGFWASPWCGIVDDDGARAGLLVWLAVTLGALVSDAVAHDLSLAPSQSRLGRGAFLNRMVPAVYAAPVFFHYLNHFA